MSSTRYASMIVGLTLALATSASAQRVNPLPQQSPAPTTGPLITLYSQDHYNGPSLKLSKATPNVGAERFPYPIASFIVNRGRWLLCSQRNFLGTCVTAAAGMYPAAFADGFAQSVVSLRPLN